MQVSSIDSTVNQDIDVDRVSNAVFLRNHAKIEHLRVEVQEGGMAHYMDWNDKLGLQVCLFLGN